MPRHRLCAPAGMVLAQVVIGRVRPALGSKSRNCWNVVHTYWGWITVLGGIANVFVGIVLMHNWMVGPKTKGGREGSVGHGLRLRWEGLCVTCFLPNGMVQHGCRRHCRLAAAEPCAWRSFPHPPWLCACRVRGMSTSCG
jgi:hypothetical protein